MKRWLFFSLLLLATCAHAQSAEPEFPAAFDAPTVTRMIAQIDSGANFPVLKVGYFLGKARPAFPVSSGLKLLETSVKKEKRGGKRWLLMQWLRAFGTLRNGPEGLDKSMVIYAGIFTEALRPKTIAEPKTIARVVDDFVFNVPSGLVTGRKQDTEFTEIALQKAIETHFRLGSTLQREPDGTPRPDFASAILAASSDDRPWIALVENAEKNPNIVKNYGFYFSAEQILRAANSSGYPHITAKTLGFLDVAEKLLSPTDARQSDIQKERQLLRDRLPETKKLAPIPPNPAPK